MNVQDNQPIINCEHKKGIMSAFPEIHLSRPAVVLPATSVDNDEVIARVRENFSGPDEEWKPLEFGLHTIFDRCGTRTRYMEEDFTLSPGAFAAQSVTAALNENGLSPKDVDLLVYGGISRENFEPATASEVAGRIGATPLHAFDVTCACAGLVEALHVVTGYFAIHHELETAVICAGEMFRDHISFDIQTPEDIATSIAGLTLGNAAVSFVVSRHALEAGSARVLAIRHKTLAEHHGLCYAPVDGHFTSHSKKLFELGVEVAPEIRALTDSVGWTPQEVDHYAFHQPSDNIIESIFDELDAKPDSRVHTHALYGNTASTAWALALDHRLRNGNVGAGDKIVGMSAAAGFTVVCFAAEWDA